MVNFTIGGFYIGSSDFVMKGTEMNIERGGSYNGTVISLDSASLRASSTIPIASFSLISYRSLISSIPYLIGW